MRRAFLALAAALLLSPSFGSEAARPIASVAPLSGLPGLDATLALPEALAPLSGGNLAAPLFEATVRLDPAAMSKAMAAQKKSFQAAQADFSGMYRALRRQALGEERPAEERASLAMTVASRYAAYFDALLKEPGFGQPTRTVAARLRDRLRDGSVVKGILYADRVERRAGRLSKLLQAREAGEESVGAAAAAASWSIPSPVPASERTRKPGGRRLLTVSMPELDRLLDALSLRLEAGLEASRRQAFAKWAEQVRRHAQRMGESSIRKTLLKGKDHKIARVPANQGLRLIPRRGGFVLKARFKSSIQDRRVWKVVKDSIEKEWRGRLVYGGKAYFLRTEVSIEPLAAGEELGEGFLILREGHKAASHAGEQGITLTRDFGYLTPAHEFGHVLGLPDEYAETYDFDSMAARHAAPLSSLMANSHANAGIVQPRHLKLAYQLLRRRRLVVPSRAGGPK